MSVGLWIGGLTLFGLWSLTQLQRAQQERERIRRQAEEQRERERIRRQPEEQQERERIRRQVKEQQERERIRRQAEEQKARREQAIETAERALNDNIDRYMRSRRRFDSRDPLAYRCDVGNVAQCHDIIENLANLNRCLAASNHEETSLHDFIAEDERFFLHDNMVGVRYLTPFQGNDTHRVFGEFRCGACQREWQSAATYTNRWQKCMSCEARCYPFEQHPLEHSEHNDEDDTRRPHDPKRCQRCLELGHICIPHKYYAMM